MGGRDRDRQRQTETDRETETKRDRQTDRETDREGGGGRYIVLRIRLAEGVGKRQAYKETQRQKPRHGDRLRETETAA